MYVLSHSFSKSFMILEKFEYGSILTWNHHRCKKLTKDFKVCSITIDPRELPQHMVKMMT